MTDNQTFLSLALFLLPPLWIRYQRNQQTKQSTTLYSKSMNELNQDGVPLFPPLPKAVQEILTKSRLAYLSTIDSDVNSSHLSLMRFTYLKSEEIIILSTNMNTKKYRMLEQQKGIALLVHDFGDSDDGVDKSEGNFSITLNGDCAIVAPGPEAERLRKAHLNHNPDYPQFIVGDDIAILCVSVRSARLCNINDHVIKWNLGDQLKE